MKEEDNIGELASELKGKHRCHSTDMLKQDLTASPGGKHYYYLAHYPGTELFSTAYGRVHGHPAVSVNNADQSLRNQERQAEDESSHSHHVQHQQCVGTAELQ